MAISKYFTLKGLRALPCCSMPHSKLSSFFFPLIFGPSQAAAERAKPTKPTAIAVWIRTGT